MYEMLCLIFSFPLTFFVRRNYFSIFFEYSFSNIDAFEYNFLPTIYFDELSISGLILQVCKNFVYSKDINLLCIYVVKYFPSFSSNFIYFFS